MNLDTSLVARHYEASRPATAPMDGAGASSPLGSATADFAETLRQGEAAAMSAMTTRADPHTLVQALTQTELALETAVAVRDRVVEAYQEILRMPV